MLTFCGFLILMLIGFMFVKEDNKKKMIKIIKDNSTLIGAGLVLLFLINSISGMKSYDTTNITFATVEESFKSMEKLLPGKEKEAFNEAAPKSTCGSP